MEIPRDWEVTLKRMKMITHSQDEYTVVNKAASRLGLTSAEFCTYTEILTHSRKHT